MKRKSILVLIASLIFMSSCFYGVMPPVFYPQTVRLGTVWYENEASYGGVWTRRGDSNVFDAVWTYGDDTITGVLTMEIRGNSVNIVRLDSSGNYVFSYSGTFSLDGRSVRGSISGGRGNWEATITGTNR